MTVCRLTGPGVEYGGNVNVTKSGYACLKWSEVTDALSSADLKFPDRGGRAAARNRCRNPTGDPGGPWCYTSVDGATVPEYCDTAGCNDMGAGVCGWTLVNGGKDADGQTDGGGHYTAIPVGDNLQASFEMKVWDPAVAAVAFRISLTAYPYGPGRSGGDGFEVPVPVAAFGPSPATAYSRVDVSWRNDFVVLTAGRMSKELLAFELDVTPSPVAYVSFAAGAAPVAVRFPYCDQTASGIIKYYQ